MKLLEFRNVHFKYSGDPSFCFKELSFFVQEGSFTTLLGANGSGKSTILNLITQFLKPKQGDIVWKGTPLHTLALKQCAQKIAFVPQSMEFAFSMSVFDYVLLGRAPHLQGLGLESTEDHEIGEATLSMVQALHLKDRLLDTLSHGEKQKVLLAKALCQETPLLLLDEPTAHLDIQAQFEILSLLRSIQKQKKMTVLMVLHQLDLACEFSEELIFLKSEKIYGQGPISEWMTTGHLKNVYGFNAFIDQNPFTGKPRITHHREEVEQINH
ncbi:MAG: ABC transporter ATP-binding protein [Deltaproteobacteria bacterium]|nr:ABC transporter ATP-binding protein [Deltaproteobacteria bacterium]